MIGDSFSINGRTEELINGELQTMKSDVAGAIQLDGVRWWNINTTFF